MQIYSEAKSAVDGMQPFVPTPIPGTKPYTSAEDCEGKRERAALDAQLDREICEALPATPIFDNSTLGESVVTLAFTGWAGMGKSSMINCLLNCDRKQHRKPAQTGGGHRGITKFPVIYQFGPASTTLVLIGGKRLEKGSGESAPLLAEAPHNTLYAIVMGQWAIGPGYRFVDMPGNRGLL